MFLIVVRSNIIMQKRKNLAKFLLKNTQNELFLSKPLNNLSRILAFVSVGAVCRINYGVMFFLF